MNSKVLAIILFSIVFVALTSTEAHADYPEAVVKHLEKSCQDNNVTKDECSCYIKSLERAIPEPSGLQDADEVIQKSLFMCLKSFSQDDVVAKIVQLQPLWKAIPESSICKPAHAKTMLWCKDSSKGNLKLARSCMMMFERFEIQYHLAANFAKQGGSLVEIWKATEDSCKEILKML